MSQHIHSYFSEMPLYQKAMDIIVLSRSISTYINHDLCTLSENGEEDEHIYFSGDIVQQSACLTPEIINAERARFSDKKHEHVEAVNRLVSKLYNNCKRLERINSNGKDYLPILKKELKKFRKLQRTWILTL